MPKCKLCETKYSLLTDYGDGLCKQCHENSIAEAARKKADFNQQFLDYSKRRIDAIAKSIAIDETPLCIVLVNWKVQEKSSGVLKKLPGMIAGVAIGGAMGQMMFGGNLLSNQATYSGELGVLVVTTTRILLGHFTAPFMSQEASIETDQLELLNAQTESNTLNLKVFEISHTHVAVSSTGTVMYIGSGDEKISFNKTELCFNSANIANSVIYPTPSLTDVCQQVRNLGTRPTPAEFATKLLTGQHPLTDAQSDEIAADNAYMTALSQSIILHSKRDGVVEKMDILTPSLKTALMQHLRNRAETYQTTQMKLLVWALLTICSLAGLLLKNDNLILLLSTIITLICSIGYLVSLKRASWCRKIIKC